MLAILHDPIHFENIETENVKNYSSKITISKNLLIKLKEAARLHDITDFKKYFEKRKHLTKDELLIELYWANEVSWYLKDSLENVLNVDIQLEELSQATKNGYRDDCPLTFRGWRPNRPPSEYEK